MTESGKCLGSYTREKVINSAIELFYRNGFRETKIYEIAKNSYLSTSSIYHCFNSKQAILHEIIESYYSNLISISLAAICSSNDSPADQLSAIVNAWAKYCAQNIKASVICKSEFSSLSKDDRHGINEFRDRQHRLIIDIIDRGIRDRQFHTPSSLVSSKLIIEMLHSIPTWFNPEIELSAEDLATRHVALARTAVGA